MSATSQAVSRAQLEYIASLLPPEDEFLQRLKRAADEAGIPQIWVSPEQSHLMQVLLQLNRAERVIEVGCLAGYSAIQMARALPSDGRVTTIEINPNHARFAEEWIAKSDVAGKVDVRLGAGADVLRELTADSFDACFIDADKTGYSTYLRECLRIVRPGGLVMVDNAFAFGEVLDRASQDADVRAIQELNQELAANPAVQALLVPIGDGCWVGVRRA